MLKIFRFVKNAYLLNRRLTADESRQKAEGYSITFEQTGPEREITYKEGEREIYVIMNFGNWMNDVVIFTDSLSRWTRPDAEPFQQI
jgi:hypothetical protein